MTRQCVCVPVCVDGVCVVEHPEGSDVINGCRLDGLLYRSKFVTANTVTCSGS